MTTQANPVANAVLWGETCPEQGVVALYGSFQGAGAASPAAARIRGSWVSAVTWVSTGLYRVQLALNIPNLIVTSQDAGLIAEPRAWITNDGAGAAGLPAALTILQTSSLDTTTNANSFQIRVYSCTVASPAVTALYDVTSADRVFFSLAWKNVAILP